MLNETQIRQQIYDAAKKYVGVKEYPANSNKCKFSQWWGMNAAWCQMFVNYIYYHQFKWCPTGGSQNSSKGTAYTPWARQWYEKNGLWLKPSQTPKIGDAIYFDWGKDGVVDHVGIVVQKYPGHVKTIEGNTGMNNWSNGGAVMECNRSLSVVAGYGSLPLKSIESIDDRLEYPEYPEQGPIETGDRGEEIGIWEARMKERGWDIEVDRYFSKDDEKILRYFQAEKGLVVDGILGPNSWAAAWEYPIT